MPVYATVEETQFDRAIHVLHSAADTMPDILAVAPGVAESNIDMKPAPTKPSVSAQPPADVALALHATIDEVDGLYAEINEADGKSRSVDYQARYDVTVPPIGGAASS